MKCNYCQKPLLAVTHVWSPFGNQLSHCVFWLQEKWRLLPAFLKVSGCTVPGGNTLSSLCFTVLAGQCSCLGSHCTPTPSSWSLYQLSANAAVGSAVVFVAGKPRSAFCRGCSVRISLLTNIRAWLSAEIA